MVVVPKLLASLYAPYTTIRCWLDPSLGPVLPEELRATSMSVVWKEFFLGITHNIKNQNSLKASWSQKRDVELSNGDLVSAIDGNWSREVHSRSIEIDNKDFLT